MQEHETKTPLTKEQDQWKIWKRLRDVYGLKHRPPRMCGQLPFEIDHQGCWHYEKSPIHRASLVHLFASVLYCDEKTQTHWLVTPDEMVHIHVKDAPFMINHLHQNELGHIVFETNVGIKGILGEKHPLVVRPCALDQQLLPYVKIKTAIWARLNRSTYYQVMDWAQEHKMDGQTHWCVQSQGFWFSLGKGETDNGF